ncbi:glycosyltransferase family 1 protein [Sphingobacterium athyrii]|uniref:Glycosyl transferase family 1 domain-containing protein n=1 Tax=Sphingobacterium athyrii TaxID=2152717 RepID=A0A363NQB7_9SPHI|nr:glycosyltransferase family 1 protein [Sphingobacterium athyrii]PUV22969.1 hypothetical protein DCO56_18795 [Sphingobacterium athyrii]
MKVIFHENQLSYRGTSVALYDYAHYNVELLGNESVIVFNRSNLYNSASAIAKFKNRFKVLSYETVEELAVIIQQETPDVFYAIKSGEKDGIYTDKCKCCIHAVFKVNEPHGDVYAYVSDWLAKEVGRGASYVPHIIDLPFTEKSLHQDLGIPATARVFGYYGGADSFDIDFVQKSVKRIAKENSNIYFIFMGVDDFTRPKYFWQRNRKYENIFFLPPNSNLEYKARFVNTCYAMLHARSRGETFGMAIGEFAIRDVPIITYRNSPERSHIEILGDDAYYYSSERELKSILTSGSLEKSAKEKYQQFSPANVMQKFKTVFLT